MSLLQTELNINVYPKFAALSIVCWEWNVGVVLSVMSNVLLCRGSLYFNNSLQYQIVQTVHALIRTNL